MRNVEKKWSIFLIATFVTFFGIIDVMVKGTHSEDIDVISLVSIENISTSLGSVENYFVLNSDKEIKEITAKHDIFNSSSESAADMFEYVEISLESDYVDKVINSSDGKNLKLTFNDSFLGNDIILGSINYDFLDDIVDGKYTFKLYDVKVLYSDDSEVFVDELSYEFDVVVSNTLLSTDNTLSKLMVNEIEIELEENKFEYNYNTNSESAFIEAISSDEKAKVTIDSSSISLEVGKSVKVTVSVMSESGDIQDYFVNITRVEDIDVVKSDVNTLSEITFGDYTIKVLENVFYYNFETYDSSVNISFKTTDEKASAELKDLTNPINLSYGVEVEMVITVTSESGKTQDYKIKALRIEEFGYTFNEEIIVDDTNKYIKYLSVSSDVKYIKDNLSVTGGVVRVLNSKEEEKNDSDILATGDKVIIIPTKGDSIVYTLSIIGDSNGDGLIDLIDLVQMRKHIVGYVYNGVVQRKEGVYFYALDFNKDEVIDLIDLVRMRKTIVGIK